MSTSSDPIVIVSAVRSPLGRFLGELAPVQAPALGAHTEEVLAEIGGLPSHAIADLVDRGIAIPSARRSDDDTR